MSACLLSTVFTDSWLHCLPFHSSVALLFVVTVHVHTVGSSAEADAAIIICLYSSSSSNLNRLHFALKKATAIINKYKFTNSPGLE